MITFMSAALATQVTSLVVLLCAWPAPPGSGPTPTLTIWHGDQQRIGHLGDAQDDFNVMGHVEPWSDVDRLTWRLGNEAEIPLAFRAFRRLVNDGDFNADIPIGRLRPGLNHITIAARFKNGARIEKTVAVRRESGSSPLPYRIRWRQLKDPQDVGQYVDGEWALDGSGLRTRQVGYDRLFLIGERRWRDYEVRTSITIHEVASEMPVISGGNGLGIVLRFAGHLAGGPRFFPSGQPKWGYQPFGAIALLRWFRGKPNVPPQNQFYRGDIDKVKNLGENMVRPGQTYRVAFRCETLPDDPPGTGRTRYSHRIWEAGNQEPRDWTWQETQISATALRHGGVALLAHHVDATFGDVDVMPLPADGTSWEDGHR